MVVVVVVVEVIPVAVVVLVPVAVLVRRLSEVLEDIMEVHPKQDFLLLRILVRVAVVVAPVQAAAVMVQRVFSLSVFRTIKSQKQVSRPNTALSLSTHRIISLLLRITIS